VSAGTVISSAPKCRTNRKGQRPPWDEPRDPVRVGVGVVGFKGLDCREGIALGLIGHDG
jgi:hypothetical protein